MKLLRLIAILPLALTGSLAWGHGFELSLNFNGSGVPASISSFSQQSQLDQQGTAGFGAMPSNLFLDQFTNVGTVGGVNQQFTDEGGPNQVSTDPSNPNTALLASWQQAGYSQPTMTFSIVSPLYYSDGMNHGGGVAVPASLGTNIYFSDAADGNPNTSGLHATLSGNSVTPVAGWQLLSPYDATPYGDFGHEIVKQLFIASASTQTAGEYGFAYTVTAHFAGGLTVTSGPLVDIYALDSSGATAAFLGSFGPGSLQDAATIAIYNAVTAQSVSVPEPASLALLLLAAIGAGLRWRQTRRS